MPSIVNGLFAGRAGLSSHGAAIAVVGDNISNASTIGYKASRAEFADLIAGGQTAGKVVGSGSQLAGVSPLIDQGTLEFTGRSLDLAVDGNGYFVVADGAERFFTRAGNFKVDASGNIVSESGKSVLGFPAGGSGSLEALNVNGVSQNSVSTKSIDVSGNVNSGSPVVAAASIPATGLTGAAAPGTATTYKDLSDLSAFSTVVDVYDSLGGSHTVTFYAFKTVASPATYQVRGYVNSEDVDTGAGVVPGLPRQIGGAVGANFTMTFGSDGSRTNVPATSDASPTIAWNNGSSNAAIDVTFDPFTAYSAPSGVLSITQDGQGVGSVSSISIQKNGDIFAILDNGQSSIIGKVGLANFSAPEGLVRVGGNLLQKSPASGEPIIGTAGAGKFGDISAGSIELSTVDIATEFVKLITLQRAFQANSRIITTINQLLNDIVQLA